MNDMNDPDPNSRLTSLKFPLSKERSDICSMRTAYDFQKLSKNDQIFLQAINKLKYQEHAWEHHSTCFKKGPECRFNFGKLKTNLNLEISDEKTEWTKCNQQNTCTQSFEIKTKRCLGDAYVNVHSKACSEILAFNNNVAIGDAQQIYYSTNYSTTNTQEEDRFEYMMMCDALGRRFEKISHQNEVNENVENIDFKQGMGHMISGIRAHVASNVIMANMASLLTMIDSRFIFSHDISYLFVNIIQDYFEENDVPIIVQIEKSDKKKKRNGLIYFIMMLFIDQKN